MALYSLQFSVYFFLQRSPFSNSFSFCFSLALIPVDAAAHPAVPREPPTAENIGEVSRWPQKWDCVTSGTDSAIRNLCANQIHSAPLETMTTALHFRHIVPVYPAFTHIHGKHRDFHSKGLIRRTECGVRSGDSEGLLYRTTNGNPRYAGPTTNGNPRYAGSTMTISIKPRPYRRHQKKKINSKSRIHRIHRIHRIYQINQINQIHQIHQIHQINSINRQPHLNLSQLNPRSFKQSHTVYQLSTLR
jgi:hypothetical protein